MRSRTNRTHLRARRSDQPDRSCSGNAWRDRLQPIAPKPMSASGRIADWSRRAATCKRAAKIKRLLARLELVLTQIAELERERDAVVETEASDKAGKMIQQLISLRGIGVQSATVLVREAFVRRFANGKALGSYAGLASSPYSSGGIDREQGIGKGGNRRLRTVMVELAWLWTRYQPAGARSEERRVGNGCRSRWVSVL